MRLPVSTAFLVSLALTSTQLTNSTLNAARQASAPVVPLANDDNSFKFAVLGNAGTGEQPQYELAEQMAALRERFNFGTVLLLGGNIDGGQRPQDFLKKFESPYRRLLDQGVTFRAVLGARDSREQRYYKLFNMNGQPYYTFTPAPGVQFFALETTYTTPAQVQWLEEQLKQSSSAWKIAFFHHPLYGSGRSAGPNEALRKTLEPLFLTHNVSVVFSARDMFYERVTPQQQISYFVVGAGGKVKPGDLDRSRGLTASGFDADLTFLAAEVAGDTMTFNVISRAGETVDSGKVMRRK